jgi:hypothetical protein
MDRSGGPVLRFSVCERLLFVGAGAPASPKARFVRLQRVEQNEFVAALRDVVSRKHSYLPGMLPPYQTFHLEWPTVLPAASLWAMSVSRQQFNFFMRAAPIVVCALLSTAITLAQPATSATVEILSNGSCRIGDIDVACSKVGSALHARRVPIHTVIRLHGDSGIQYEQVSVTLTSLRDAGYLTKLGYINSGSD